jgi:hypothetical protein
VAVERLSDLDTRVHVTSGVPPWALVAAFAIGIVIAGALIVTFVRIEDAE